MSCKSTPFGNSNRRKKIPFRKVGELAKSQGWHGCKRSKVVEILKEHGVIKPPRMSFNFFMKNIRKLCADRCDEICFSKEGIIAQTGFQIDQFCGKPQIPETTVFGERMKKAIAGI